MLYKYEPPKRRLRIQNRLRFILFLLLILLPVITFFIQHTGRTETKWVEYRPYVVSYGDTYWQLARKAQDNGYNADIRVIIDRMVERSGIKAHELKEGDIIWIPEIMQ